jgi:hypothetical protein
MAQTQTANFSLVTSGQSIALPNAVQNSGTLTVSYVAADTVTVYSVNVEGVQNSTGDFAILDSFTNQTGNSGSRSISLSGVVYDSFRFVPSFTTTNQSFSIGVTATNTGSGAPYASNLNLAVVHTV